jgi:hypothetical protein
VIGTDQVHAFALYLTRSLGGNPASEPEVIVEYDPIASVAIATMGDVEMGRVPVTIGDQVGIIRHGRTYYLSIDDQISLVISTTGDPDSVFLSAKVQQQFEDLAVSVFGNDLETLAIHRTLVLSVASSVDWKIIQQFSCQPLVLPDVRCATSWCRRPGNCLRVVSYGRKIQIGHLQCEMGMPICKDTIGIAEDAFSNNKHLIIADQVRGYLTEPADDIVSVLDEYDENQGFLYKVVATDDELDAYLETRREGVLPDVVIRHVPTQTIYIYRTQFGQHQLLGRYSYTMPSGLTSDRLEECTQAVVGMYQDAKQVDSCVNTVVYQCTNGCDGWIYHPQVLEDQWTFSVQAQGIQSIVISPTTTLTQGSPGDPILSLDMNTDDSTLVLRQGGLSITPVIPLSTWAILSVCLSGKYLIVRIDDTIVYRVTHVPITGYIWASLNAETPHLVNPRLNGAAMAGWLGDAVGEDMVGCGETPDDTTETVHIKDLHPECESGRMVYRTIRKTLTPVAINTVYDPGPQVYRAYVDIYIENQAIEDTTVAIWYSSTLEVIPPDTIVPGKVIPKGMTYKRKAQPVLGTETIRIQTPRSGLSVLLQVVEEEYRR